MLAVLVPWPFCVNFRIVLSIATKCLTEVLAEIVLCLCCVRQHLHRRHRSVCMWCPSACSLLCLLSSVLRGSQPWARVLLITPKHFSFWAVVNGIILFYLDDNILISGVRNTVDFCMFTLFSVSYWSHTSVKEEIFDVCFWIESFGFSAQMSCHLQMRIVSLSLSLFPVSLPSFPLASFHWREHPAVFNIEWREQASLPCSWSGGKPSAFHRPAWCQLSAF